jgi:hypothetical protein
MGTVLVVVGLPQPSQCFSGRKILQYFQREKLVSKAAVGQSRRDKSPFDVGLPQEPDSEFGPVPGPVENVKPANLSDISVQDGEETKNKKSPQNVELSGLSESSPDRRPTQLFSTKGNTC